MTSCHDRHQFIVSFSLQISRKVNNITWGHFSIAMLLHNCSRNDLSVVVASMQKMHGLIIIIISPSSENSGHPEKISNIARENTL